MKSPFALPLLLLAACGGGGSSGPISQSTAEDYCRQGCEHTVECDPSEDVDTCTAECAAFVTGNYREDAFIAMTECYVDLDCATSDDVCFQECSPTGAHNAFESRCRESLALCDLGLDEIDQICEVTPTADADVGTQCVLTPAHMEELSACFDLGGCQAQLDCLSGSPQ